MTKYCEQVRLDASLKFIIQQQYCDELGFRFDACDNKVRQVRVDASLGFVIKHLVRFDAQLHFKVRQRYCRLAT